MKRCSKCKTYSEDFGPHSKNKDGLHSWCRPCVRADNRARYHANREVYAKKNRASRLRNVYGIAPDAYDSLDKVCEICGSTNDIHIDHDHRSKSFRGLLCGRCNRGIGMFLDDPLRLESAIGYLQRAGR